MHLHGQSAVTGCSPVSPAASQAEECSAGFMSFSYSAAGTSCLLKLNITKKKKKKVKAEITVVQIFCKYMTRLLESLAPGNTHRAAGRLADLPLDLWGKQAAAC